MSPLGRQLFHISNLNIKKHDIYLILVHVMYNLRGA